MKTAHSPSGAQLSLIVNEQLVPIFFQLLGHGFQVNVQTGCTVKELLCNQLGINEEYLTQKIQSIFLNGKVVDDVMTAIVPENATVALSGAMPGLVGAILRSGESYAAMRTHISHSMISPATDATSGQIKLKLWNMVVKEIGPAFLAHGTWIEAEELRSFIERHCEALTAGCTSVESNGSPLATDQLPDLTWQTGLVLLRVMADKR